MAAERSPSEVKAEIEAARDQLAHTVDELSNRLAPKKLVGDTKEQLKEKLTSPVGLAAVAGSAVLITLLIVRNLRKSKR